MYVFKWMVLPWQVIVRKQRLQQRGDTIVEVIIVLAVFSMAIAISWATASRSLSNARQAQENSEATALVQGQAEALRSLASQGKPAPPTPPTNRQIYRAGEFCIDQRDPANYVVVTSTDADYSTVCTQGSVSYAIRVVACQYSPALNAACTTHTSDDSFVVTATWDNIRGQGKDQAKTVYRVHPTMP
jgi:type II secretory pathway pseudopilin PulG